jgi:hypothetical protein
MKSDVSMSRGFATDLVCFVVGCVVGSFFDTSPSKQRCVSTVPVLSKTTHSSRAFLEKLEYETVLE